MNAPENSFDIVVCGAGPAGATTSLFLSQQGISHLVIDAAGFPRSKVCGDGITPMCITILEQVIPDIKKVFQHTLHAKRIRGFRIYGPNLSFGELQISKVVPENQNEVYTIPRFTFDHFLVQQLKQKPQATLWENTRLIAFEKNAGGLLLHLNQDGRPLLVHTKLVIAADGDRSVFRKALFSTAINRSQMVAAIRTYYRNVEPLPGNDQYELYALNEVLPGYFWMFPMADGSFNVGLGITAEAIQEKRLNLRQLMEQLIATHPLLHKRFARAEKIKPVEGSGLPVTIETEPILSGANILLTGDAGALADPISGEGIGPSLVSGKYAALTAAEALKHQNFSADFLKRYDRKMHEKITRAYEIRVKLFYWFIKKPWRMHLLLKAAPGMAWLRNFLANAVSGAYTTGDLKSIRGLKNMMLRRAAD